VDERVLFLAVQAHKGTEGVDAHDGALPDRVQRGRIVGLALRRLPHARRQISRRTLRSAARKEGHAAPVSAAGRTRRAARSAIAGSPTAMTAGAAPDVVSAPSPPAALLTAAAGAPPSEPMIF